MIIKKIGIVGAGVMGKGIAQLFIMSGKDVYLHDVSSALVEQAEDYIKTNIQKLIEKGKIKEENAIQFLNHLYKTPKIEGLSACDLIIEAVPENINLKKELFKKLEDIAKDSSILSTNTSSFSVTEIASVCRKPQRVAGLHFFNPVVLMKMVEIVKGVMTDTQVCEDLVELVKSTGHTPIKVSDTPGFVVNHAGRAYVTESLSILEESIGHINDIDMILKKSVGFKMGPFELLDLTGADVTHPVTESIYNQFYQDPKYRPSYLLRLRMFAGLLGRKTGQGFYSYNNASSAKRIENFDLNQPPIEISEIPAVWVSRTENNYGYHKIIDFLKKTGVSIEETPLPSKDSLCIVAPLGWDATTVILKDNLDPTRTVAVDTLLDLNNCVTLMSTPILLKNYKEAALSIFRQTNKDTVFINDSPGFVVQRILAMIVNIGCTIAQKGIASPKDIDTAVKIGLGYPKGPLELGDYVGAKTILTILERLYDTYKDMRYRPSIWLIRRAKLGISLLYEDMN